MSARNAIESSSSPILDPAYYDKKIADLSDDELITLGFLGENAMLGVKHVVERVKANPDLLGAVTCWMVDCFRNKYTVRAPSQDSAQPTTSSISPVEGSTLNRAS